MGKPSYVIDKKICSLAEIPLITEAGMGETTWI
jgi:hypothetical protein